MFRFASLLSIMLTSLLVAGCGSPSSTTKDASPAASSDAGSLSHVDGTIAATNDGFTLTPKKGGATMAFTLGPAVEAGPVRALEASGAVARVTYSPSDDTPLVAAFVRPAPKIGEGMQSYVGTVVKVDDTTLVVKGDDGTRAFDISGADTSSFDVPHLEQHADAQSPIRVYYDPKAPSVGVAYEDA